MKLFPRLFLAIILGLCSGALVASALPLPQDAKGNQQSGGTTQAKPGQSGQSGQGTTTPPGAPTAAENQAFQAISQEFSAGLDPGKIVSLSEDFVQKFPSSQYLSAVYTFEASGYQQLGDAQKTVDAGEKGLKLNGDNLLALIIVSSILPQPQMMNGGDLDKQKRLDEAEADANHALQLIDKLPKQPNEADDAFKKRKDGVATEPYGALGMVHLQRAMMGLMGVDKSELDKSAENFKKSVELTDRPSPQYYYRLGEVYGHLDKVDDAIAAFSKASELGQGSPLQALADKQVDELKKKQAQSKPPATK